MRDTNRKDDDQTRRIAEILENDAGEPAKNPAEKLGIEESDVLKIVVEDILRMLGERKGKTSLDSIRVEIRVSPSLLSKAIGNLEQEDLISVEEGVIKLTKNGRGEAKDIVKKHLFLETYFKETRNEREAHQAAHLLEHYISEEVINNIRKISTLEKEGAPLIESGLHKKVLITDIMTSDYSLFERMISMGLLPGVVIEMANRIPNGVIVKTNSNKIVLDNSIAKEIKVLEYEES